MTSKYVETALLKARYGIIDDEEPYYAEVPGLQGVYATGKTMKECRENLRGVIGGWIKIRAAMAEIKNGRAKTYTLEEVLERLEKKKKL